MVIFIPINNFFHLICVPFFHVTKLCLLVIDCIHLFVCMLFGVVYHFKRKLCIYNISFSMSLSSVVKDFFLFEKLCCLAFYIFHVSCDLSICWVGYHFQFYFGILLSSILLRGQSTVPLLEESCVFLRPTGKPYG